MAEAIEKTDHANRNIESFLMSGQMLEIERNFAFDQLNLYLQDLLFLQHGGEFKDLGISQRRMESFPRFIIPNDFSTASFNVVDQQDIENNDVPKGSIALLNLSGVMRTQSGISSNGVNQLASDLRSAYTNKNVTGVVLEILSGGGESMAGNILKSALSERTKPVVAFGHRVASAAYRAATGTDEIILSSASAEAGSLGTMIQIDIKQLERFREQHAEFYGADAPNKNGDFRSAIGGDFSVIQNRVDELTREFHDEIKRDRQLQGDAETIKETLSGAMFNAISAKKRGLIDAIGNLPFAVRRVNALRSKY